jgi:hypothetical protein
MAKTKRKKRPFWDGKAPEELEFEDIERVVVVDGVD